MSCLKQSCTPESSSPLLIQVLAQWVHGGARDPAFLTSSQWMRIVLGKWFDQGKSAPLNKF